MSILTRTLCFVVLCLSARQVTADTVRPAPRTIPFAFEDGLIWVKVAAGSSTLHFIVDSGAGSTIIDLETAHRLGMTPGSARTVFRVGEVGKAWRINDFSGTVGGIPLERQIYAVKLHNPGETNRQQPDGMVGQDFFKGRIIEIDYKTHVIRLLDEAPQMRRSTNLPIRFQGDAMCVPVSVNSCLPAWTRLDTGCGSTLEWVAPVREVVRPGNTAPQLITTADVQLGSKQLHWVKISLHSKPIFPREAGLLGNGLLSQFRVVIDARKMILLLGKP